MVSSSFYHAIAIVAVGCWSTGHAQQIIPTPTIQGKVDDFVLIMCVSTVSGQSSSNRLQIYQPIEDSFITFESPRLDRNNEVGGSISNYTFGPLTAEDNGTIFLCTSSSRNSDNSTIIVIFPPTITRVSPIGDNLSVLEKDQLTVVVNVSANPQPEQDGYVWTRNGDSISNPMITTSLTSINFNRVLREDAGFYSLTVMNSAGTDMHNFTLDVMYIPEFNMDLSDTFNCSVRPDTVVCASYPGVNGMLFCRAGGNPSPTVNVTTYGVDDISNVNFGTGSDIAITSVTSGNAGRYICNASSSIGSDTRVFRLFVGGVPQGLNSVMVRINKTNRYVLIVVVYDSAVNQVPATFIHSTVTCMTNSTTLLRNKSPVAASLTYNVSFNQLSGCRDFQVSATVENVQGNSSAVVQMFMVDGFVVLSGSPMLSLLLLVIAMLFY